MKSILITGGSGSFGRAFTRRLLNMPGGPAIIASGGPERIAIFSRGEHAQEDMARTLSDDRMRFFIGDVRDRYRLEMAMRGVDTVVHAAALKVVPIAEYNPTECVATNVYGAENVVLAALRSGVKRVIALSTDKAVNPINLYGATKLAAEKIFVAANAMSAGQCNFSIVRYGNVAGSRGSVAPLFNKMKAAGRALPITDQRMTRFWITMDQAIDLVLEAITFGYPGAIYVPKIPSMRVMDLAEAIDPGGIREYVGIRPGEKLHECLITEDESRKVAETQSYYVINGAGTLGESQAPEGFRYTSDTNSQWLTVEQLKELL